MCIRVHNNVINRTLFVVALGYTCMTLDILYLHNVESRIVRKKTQDYDKKCTISFTEVSDIFYKPAAGH